jgi:hypothetical protein
MDNNNSILQTYNGLIRFYDGTIIAIEDQEYSANGLTFWEKTFNPNSHISTFDGVTLLDGHKYRRVKHSGDTNWQLPYRIVPKEPEFRIEEGVFQWKFIEDTTWTDLLDTELLRGENGAKGDKGIPGDGLQIDAVGYIMLRPDCCGTLTTGCNSCNTSVSDTTVPYLFLSIGDGVLVLTTTLIGDGEVEVGGVTYTHFSNIDPLTGTPVWTAISSGINGFEVRYLATSSAGTVWTDMRNEDYYSSRGHVYVCADGRWAEFVDLNVPVYMVQETTGSTNIGYLDNFVDDYSPGVTATVDECITINSDGKLSIIEHTITGNAFNDSAFSDGLNYTNGAVHDDYITVDAEDFTGYGLRVYTSDDDGWLDMQVYVQDFISDGLTYEATISIDGETRDKIIVNVDDIVSPTTGTDFTGLVTSTDLSITETDGYDNIYVQPGDCILVDVDGVNVVADELTIAADGETELRVWETDSATKGIQNIHIHPNAVNENKGLYKDGQNSIEVLIEATTFGFNGDGEIYILDNAIHGNHLNDDTCDNTKGVEISNDMITVKVDGTTIDFNGSGELTVLPSSDNIVNTISLFLNGSLQGIVDGEVKWKYIDTNSISVSVAANPSTDIVDLSFDVNRAWVEDIIEEYITDPSLDVYWGTLGYSVGNPTLTIEDYITSLKHVELNRWYTNMQISDGTGEFVQSGLMVKSPVGRVFKLIVDDNGNFDREIIIW